MPLKTRTSSRKKQRQEDGGGAGGGTGGRFLSYLKKKLGMGTGSGSGDQADDGGPKPESAPPVDLIVEVDVPPPPPPVKNKREAVVQTGYGSDEDRYKVTAEANREALDMIYDSFYGKDGNRLDGGTRLRELYNLMGKGKPGYLKDAVDGKDFAEFQNTPATKVIGQNVDKYRKALAKYKKRLREYNKAKRASPDTRLVRPRPPKGPKTNEESAVKGDYFHVDNLNYNRRQRKRGRARRIIVNVNSQEAALKVSGKLSALYQDKAIAPFISEHKVFLSTTPAPDRPVKYDKLVVYYLVDDTKPGGDDVVGDEIVEAIESAVDPGDFDEKFAPFYSRIQPGVAWAEEPKYFVRSLQDSFTQTRADIITRVIKNNKNIAGKKAFVDLVARAMRRAKVDPVKSHRHLADASKATGAGPSRTRRLSPARPSSAPKVGTS